jgi:catechol 2,3-dioxygenase-like lactoylglutathione lyase family enzyme
VESAISNLLSRYEKGMLTRRQLVKAMTMLAAFGAVPAEAQQSGTVAAPGFQATQVEHVSIFVRDRQRSKEFYQNVFGLTVVNDAEDATRLGPGRIMVVLRPVPEKAGRVDHLCLGISASKESVIADLKKRGATVLEGGEANLHVKDPDGLIIELIANDRSWR